MGIGKGNEGIEENRQDIIPAIIAAHNESRLDRTAFRKIISLRKNTVTEGSALHYHTEL